ncbi:MAG: GNAT family N-acetyltransferase [Planctomycetota bacterium]
MSEKTTYELEMRSREELAEASCSLSDVDVRRVDLAFPELNWFLHQIIGGDYRWGGRDSWKRSEWSAYAARPELETWVAYVQGTPAGYFELESQTDGSQRIECFGIRNEFFGKGLGAHLLTVAVRRAWERTDSRVWLRTCSHDHPHALSNYRARGFRVTGKSSGPENPPFRSHIFGGESAP